jgi:glucose/arabinose dehydrogenase
MAFAPDYARSGLLYLYLTDNGGGIVILEYRRARGSPDRADPRSKRLVIRQEHSANFNHHGGQVAFGPDGLLYAALGDGGGSGDPLGAGQRLNTLLGKMIRVDPRRSGRRGYRVPRDNPFVGRRGLRPEIFAYGLRNPYRSRSTAEAATSPSRTWGRATSRRSISPRGRATGPNFGWSVFEGTRRMKAG